MVRLSCSEESRELTKRSFFSPIIHYNTHNSCFQLSSSSADHFKYALSCDKLTVECNTENLMVRSKMCQKKPGVVRAALVAMLSRAVAL
jgi:hypothetical protein